MTTERGQRQKMVLTLQALIYIEGKDQQTSRSIWNYTTGTLTP